MSPSSVAPTANPTGNPTSSQGKKKKDQGSWAQEKLESLRNAGSLTGLESSTHKKAEIGMPLLKKAHSWKTCSSSVLGLSMELELEVGT